MVLRRDFLALGNATSVPCTALAQSYPSRPIKFILPFPAGSATDGAARHVAEALRRRIGQPVVVENQAGGDGIIATQNAKRAPPDDYTLLVSTSSAHGVAWVSPWWTPPVPSKEPSPTKPLQSLWCMSSRATGRRLRSRTAWTRCPAMPALAAAASKLPRSRRV